MQKGWSQVKDGEYDTENFHQEWKQVYPQISLEEEREEDEAEQVSGEEDNKSRVAKKLGIPIIKRKDDTAQEEVQNR